MALRVIEFFIELHLFHIINSQNLRQYVRINGHIQEPRLVFSLGGQFNNEHKNVC